MSGRVVALVLGLSLASLGATAPTSQSSSSTSASPSRRTGYSERYGLLEERNIFVRERATSRRSSRGGSDSATTRSAPRPPEERFVLTGVVLEEDGYRAYIENDRREVLRLAPGDKVARGHVAAIMIDAIAYDPTPATGNMTIAATAPAPIPAAGATTAPSTAAASSETSATPAQRVWVEIGCDLTGKPSSMLAELSYTSSGSATTQPTTGPAIAPEVANLNPNDPNLTAEQRMKLRRAMELQKKYT